jgi:hypothetical protein
LLDDDGMCVCISQMLNVSLHISSCLSGESHTEI